MQADASPPMTEGRTLAKQAGSFTVMTYGANAVNAVAALFIARALGPEGAGLWGIARVLANYLGWTQVGVLDAASREIPYWAAHGDEARANRVQNVALSHVAAGSAAVSLLCLALATFAPSGSHSRTLFFFLACYGPILQAVNGFLTLLRGRKRFADIAVAALASAALNLLLGPAAASTLGLRPFLAAMLLLNAANLAFWLRRTADQPWRSFAWAWCAEDVAHLVRIGLPMFLGGVGFTLLTTLDSLIVSRFVDAATLGWYTFAAALCTYVVQIPNAVSVVTFPHFQERLARGGRPEDLRSLFVVPTFVFAGVLLPPLVAAAYFGAPWLVAAALPQFTPALPILRILLVGVYFSALTNMAGQLLITLNLQTRTLPLVLAAAGLNAIGCTTALAQGAGPIGAATAAAVANTLFLLALFSYASSRVQTTRETIKDSFALLACGAAVFGVLAGIDAALPSAAGIWSGLSLAAAKLALSLVLMSPLALFAEHRTGFWRHLRAAPGKARPGTR